MVIAPESKISLATSRRISGQKELLGSDGDAIWERRSEGCFLFFLLSVYVYIYIYQYIYIYIYSMCIYLILSNTIIFKEIHVCVSSKHLVL